MGAGHSTVKTGKWAQRAHLAVFTVLWPASTANSEDCTMSSMGEAHWLIGQYSLLAGLTAVLTVNTANCEAIGSIHWQYCHCYANGPKWASGPLRAFFKSGNAKHFHF